MIILLTMWGYSKKAAIYKPERGSSPGMKFTDILILVLVYRNVSHSIYGILVIAAWAD